MEDLAAKLLDKYVLVYLLVVVLAALIPGWLYARRRQDLAREREKAGLPEGTIVSAADKLERSRSEALVQAGSLLAAIVVTPFVLNLIATQVVSAGAASSPDVDDQAVAAGLGLTFAGLLLWLLVQGTDVSKAFLGGVALRTLIAFKRPFQVGDRATLKGIGGKVLEIGVFYVKLQTPDDDLISIPTSSLWSDVLTSANAGDRASLVVMRFYLSPKSSAEDRQRAESAIWDAIQASPYLDAGKPMQIFYSQEPGHIGLTAKAYVASTYNDPMFGSDVTRAFLEFAQQNEIELAAPPWPAGA